VSNCIADTDSPRPGRPGPSHPQVAWATPRVALTHAIAAIATQSPPRDLLHNPSATIVIRPTQHSTTQHYLSSLNFYSYYHTTTSTTSTTTTTTTRTTTTTTTTTTMDKAAVPPGEGKESVGSIKWAPAVAQPIAFVSAWSVAEGRTYLQ